ncbi:MAG: hypothetical protein Q7R64_02760 [bacterium]|nr:hypothetical protein [bacterium]
MNKKIGLLVCVSLFTGLALLTLPVIRTHADENKDQGNSSRNGSSDKDNKHDKKNRDDIRAVGSTLEVHISDNGIALVRGAKVTAVSGSIVTASTVWGATTLSWTVMSDTTTNLLRRSGGKSNLSEFSVGDFISFQGPLNLNSANLTVNAKILKNWSVQKKNASLIGKILSLGANSFVLAVEEHGQITVALAQAVSISKNDRDVVFSDLHSGDKVSASGVFDETSKVLTASKVKIYMDKTAVEHVFEGTLKAVSGTTLPTSFTLTLNERTDVTVNVPLGISVVGKTYLGVSLADFRVGDKVRVWGLREGATIDATVVRNVSLPR